MTKITNKKAGFLFARNKRVFLNSVYLGHLALLSFALFKYRAPHANRPTQPRKRFL